MLYYIGEIIPCTHLKRQYKLKLSRLNPWEGIGEVKPSRLKKGRFTFHTLRQNNGKRKVLAHQEKSWCIKGFSFSFAFSISTNKAQYKTTVRESKSSQKRGGFNPPVYTGVAL